MKAVRTNCLFTQKYWNEFCEQKNGKYYLLDEKYKFSQEKLSKNT